MSTVLLICTNSNGTIDDNYRQKTVMNMLTNIAGIMQEYAQEHDYYDILEYNAGANVMLDKFLLQDKEYALFQNIIETAGLTNTDTGRYLNVERTIEFTMLKKSPTKDDEGQNYYPIIYDLENRLLDFYVHLQKTVPNIMDGAIIETGIDTYDATMVLAKLTITIIDNVPIC